VHFNHLLWNESLNSDGQQFHQYQQNEQSHISSIVIISQIWKSKILLVEETGENHQPASSDCQTSSHNVVSSTPYHEWGLN
jgi:hypothetical protein